MRRADDVFFFTLIDFLIQVFFFSLVVYAVVEGQANKAAIQDSNAAKVLKHIMQLAGVSNIVELENWLTQMGPIRNLPGLSPYLSDPRDIERFKKLMKAVEEAGGVDALLIKIKSYDDAYGLPPCESEFVDGKTRARSIALIRVQDKEIEIVESTPDFDRLLSQMGTNLEAVRRLSLDLFAARFRSVNAITDRPCRHFVTLRVETEFRHPMEVVGGVFYTAGRKP